MDGSSPYHENSAHPGYAETENATVKCTGGLVFAVRVCAPVVVFLLCAVCLQ